MGLYSDIDDFLDSSDRPRKPKPSSSQPPSGSSTPPPPPPLGPWNWFQTANNGPWAGPNPVAYCDPNINFQLFIPMIAGINTMCAVSFKFEYEITSLGLGTPGGLPFWCLSGQMTCGTATTHQYLGNNQYRIETTGPCPYVAGSCYWHDAWHAGAIYADTYTITPTLCECDGVAVTCPPPRTNTITGLTALDCCGANVVVGQQTPQSILHEWAYGYHNDWIYDFNDLAHTFDPNVSLVTPIWLPPIGFGTPPPNPSPCTAWGANPQYIPPTPPGGIPFTPIGTPITLQDFHSLASCTTLLHMGVTPPPPNVPPPPPPQPAIGYQLYIRNETAYLDYPNQVSFCNWRTEWDSNMDIWNTSGQTGPQPTFISPVPPNNNPGGLMTHELWGMTTTQAEDVSLICACDIILGSNVGAYSFAHAGELLYPPADLTVSPPINSQAVIGEWYMGP